MLLEKLLDRLRLRVETFGFCRLGPGERVTVAADQQATLHYVMRGHVRFRGPGGDSYDGPGHSLVIVPPGYALEILATDARAAAEATGAAHLVACGRIKVSYGSDLDLFAALRQPLGLSFVAQPVIPQSFVMLEEDLRLGRPGAKFQAESLMRQCLLMLLRELCGSAECRLDWLNSLEDARLVRALDMMLDRPEHPFRLEDLASAAGMSRSIFADRFVRAFGETPIRFLNRIRMNRAHELIRSGTMPIKAVGRAVGFELVSHFSRLFRDHFGTPPGALRKEGQQ